MSLRPRDREYLIAKVATIDAALDDLRSSARSTRERAAVELLVATRQKLMDALALGQDGDEPSDPAGRR